jgi:hypothetical protein
MAIFSRRTIDKMISENAAFLTKKQLDTHVSKLDREDDFQSLATEWEMSVLNAFSKLGHLVHEPSLEGPSQIDLLFTHDDGSTFLADITAVSDEGFEEDNPVKAFEIELRKRLKKANLLYKGWVLDIGEIPTGYGERRKPALPPRGEFYKEIFNSTFKEFLRGVKEQSTRVGHTKSEQRRPPSP